VVVRPLLTFLLFVESSSTQVDPCEDAGGIIVFGPASFLLSYCRENPQKNLVAAPSDQAA
jgi:hypothetical protein